MWARYYEARNAAGRLAFDELDVLLWEDALKEIDAVRWGT